MNEIHAVCTFVLCTVSHRHEYASKSLVLHIPTSSPVLPVKQNHLQWFQYRSKRCAENQTLQEAGVKDGSILHQHLRLRGGGGDGGATGAESRSSYLEMYMEKKPDKVWPRA
jgi:hypothetical protein